MSKKKKINYKNKLTPHQTEILVVYDSIVHPISKDARLKLAQEQLSNEHYTLPIDKITEALRKRGRIEKKKRVPNVYESTGKHFSIDEVLSKITDFKERVKFGSARIRMNSQRYITFKEKGTKCVCCGIEGKYFKMDKFKHDKYFHFNLYALNEKGQEVLMTKDHIDPKSNGGKNHIDNYQTMCTICNFEKSDSTE